MLCFPFLKSKATKKDASPPPYSSILASSVGKEKVTKRIFFGRIVHSKSLKELEILHKAALGVDESGIIKFLDEGVHSGDEAERKNPDFEDAEIITLKPLQFLFPGLIDCHMHAPQWPNLAIGMEGDLKEWVENYTDPIEASYKDTGKAKRVYSEMVQKELENGSTTVAYNSSIHYKATNVLSDMCLKYGQRAIIGKLCININSTHGNWENSVEDSLEDERKAVDYIKKIDPKGSLVIPCIQPRCGSFVTGPLMEGLGKMSQNGGDVIRVQTHMCETNLESQEMKKVHPYFDSYADMYDHYGLFHEKSIVAHCIHLSERDVELMAARGIGVAHNPNSNTCLTDGECRVRQLLDAGIKVGLGTDCSAGYSPSIMCAMRQASNVSRHLVMHTGNEAWKMSTEEIIFLGTLGGAQVCALADRTGNFEPDKEFDALLIDVGSNDNININGWENDDLALVKKWIFLGDDRSIRLVWVNGRLVAGKDM